MTKSLGCVHKIANLMDITNNGNGQRIMGVFQERSIPFMHTFYSA